MKICGLMNSVKQVKNNNLDNKKARLFEKCRNKKQKPIFFNCWFLELSVHTPSNSVFIKLQYYGFPSKG